MKTASPGYFDENGNWQSDTDKPVVMSTPPSAMAQADVKPAPAPMMATTRTAGTTGSRPARKHLPRTSSSLVLFELLSGFSLLGGISLRQLRKRSA